MLGWHRFANFTNGTALRGGSSTIVRCATLNNGFPHFSQNLTHRFNESVVKAAMLQSTMMTPSGFLCHLTVCARPHTRFTHVAILGYMLPATFPLTGTINTDFNK